MLPCIFSTLSGMFTSNRLSLRLPGFFSNSSIGCIKRKRFQNLRWKNYNFCWKLDNKKNSCFYTYYLYVFLHIYVIFAICPDVGLSVNWFNDLVIVARKRLCHRRNVGNNCINAIALCSFYGNCEEFADNQSGRSIERFLRSLVDRSDG